MVTNYKSFLLKTPDYTRDYNDKITKIIKTIYIYIPNDKINIKKINELRNFYISLKFEINL